MRLRQHNSVVFGTLAPLIHRSQPFRPTLAGIPPAILRDQRDKVPLVESLFVDVKVLIAPSERAPKGDRPPVSRQRSLISRSAPEMKEKSDCPVVLPVLMPRSRSPAH